MRKKHLSPTKKKKKKRKITKRNGMFEASTAEYIYIYSFKEKTKAKCNSITS